MEDHIKKNQVQIQLQLESNMANWIRNMMLTLSVVITLLVYFENTGKFKYKMAIFCIYVLLFTVVFTGIMSIIKYIRRKKEVEKMGLVLPSLKNNWYFLTSIFVLIGCFAFSYVLIFYTTYINQ